MVNVQHVHADFRILQLEALEHEVPGALDGQTRQTLHTLTHGTPYVDHRSDK